MCDKVVCDKERWCVCVCDKVVCERWRVTKKDCVCVTKLCVKVVCVCVKESVWQSCVWKMMRERWPVTVCKRWCVCVNVNWHSTWTESKLGTDMRHHCGLFSCASAPMSSAWHLKSQKYLAAKHVTYSCDYTKRNVPQNMNWLQDRHWHAASLQTCNWRNEVCHDLLCSIADPHDAVWKHQSMSLTPVTTQNETSIAVVRKCKTPQNMNWVQDRHWHAASLRTCFFWPALECQCLACDFFPHRYNWRNEVRNVTYIGSLHVAPNHSRTEGNQRSLAQKLNCSLNWLKLRHKSFVATSFRLMYSILTYIKIEYINLNDVATKLMSQFERVQNGLQDHCALPDAKTNQDVQSLSLESGQPSRSILLLRRSSAAIRRILCNSTSCSSIHSWRTVL